MRQRRFYDNLPSFVATQDAPPLSKLIFTYILSLLVFATTLALRFWIDDYLLGTFPYVTFFPAVVVVAFVFGIPQGILIAILGGLASWYFFIPPYFTFSMSVSTAIAMTLYVFVVVTDIGLTALMMRAYRSEKAARAEMQRLAEHQKVMAQELDHRLKNIFATISAIINLSQKHAHSIPQFAAALRERLNAMARSNLLLRGLRSGEETTVCVIIAKALEPFGVMETKKLRLDGPPIPVSGQAVILLSLVLHELGTNAAKYGSLSVDSGEIHLSWTQANIIQADGTPCEMLTLCWREQGGPEPKAPEQGNSGFGSTLVRRVIAAVRGTVHITYAPTGVVAEFSIPVDVMHEHDVAAD
ncbi:HWE histidine kinase domain-containing protein [Rhizobium sp.]|jgi:two-component sensor histidine kinase|uniref:sensor histidine kinase n=1 Tax=Rhizobium sp. TaxID=391 RepID=UPI000E99E1B4|nr:histidine kinase [Rhizobium sp.]